MWLLHYRYLMGDRWGFNIPLVGFKPDPIIVCSHSQSGDAISDLIEGRELYWIHLFGEFRIDVEAVFDDLRGHRWRGSRPGGHVEAA